MYFTETTATERRKSEKDKLNELDSTPIPVDGDITPITYAPIIQINAEIWNDADTSIDTLYEQLSTLHNRLSAIPLQQTAAIQSIRSGITTLRTIIDSREVGE